MIILATLLLSGAALLLSICALSAARRTSGPSLLRRLSALSKSFEDMACDVDSIRSELLKQLQRERARANMATMRASRRATEPAAPEASPNGADGSGAMTEDAKDKWTREMNLKIVRGEVKLPGR